MPYSRAVALAFLALAACDLRPQAEPAAESAAEPVAEPAAEPAGPVAQAVACADGPPERLVVERAGQRTIDIPSSELAKVRGSFEPADGAMQGRLLVPISVLGAKRLQVVPCAGDAVEIASSDRIALTPNKRGHLKLVNLDADGSPIVKNIAVVRILE